jgi:hypothetical protein
MKLKTKILLVVALFFAAILVIGELSARRIFPGGGKLFVASVNPRLVYEHNPNAVVWYNGHNRVIPSCPCLVEINSNGFFDSDRAMKKPDKVFRIVGVGDTEIAGYGLKKEDSKLAQLEGLLNTGSADTVVETINLGVGGYHYTQNVENLIVNGIKYEPNLAIVNVGPSDLRGAMPLDILFGRGPIFNFFYYHVRLFKMASYYCVGVRRYDRKIRMNEILEAFKSLADLESKSEFKVVYTLHESPRGRHMCEFVRHILESGNHVIVLNYPGLDQSNFIPNDWHLNALGNQHWARIVACALARESYLPELVSDRVMGYLSCGLKPEPVKFYENEEPPEFPQLNSSH